MKSNPLVNAHREIDPLFHRHQLALIERNADNATATLSLLAGALARHTGQEQTWIYPAYALAGARKGASLATLNGEHRKLDEILRAMVERLDSMQAPFPSENVLQLLALEHRFGSLLEHHFLREENLVFPWLEARLDPAERERLYSRCDYSPVPSQALAVPSDVHAR